MIGVRVNSDPDICNLQVKLPAMTSRRAEP